MLTRSVLPRHATASCLFVVRHDALVPTTPPRFVSELAFDEYRRHCALQSEDPVTLPQVLEVAAGCGLGVYLDVKQILPAALPGLVGSVTESGCLDRVVAASFRSDIAADIKRPEPDVLTSVLFHDPHLDLVSLVEGVGCDFVHPCFDIFADPLRFFTDDWVRRVSRTGAGLIAWNVTCPAVADVVVAANVRGACADDPQVLTDALVRHRGTPRLGAVPAPPPTRCGNGF